MRASLLQKDIELEERDFFKDTFTEDGTGVSAALLKPFAPHEPGPLNMMSTTQVMSAAEIVPAQLARTRSW